MQIETRECRINDKKRIALLFSYDEDIIFLVKQIEGRRWSASNRFWHIPFQENYLEVLNNKFNGKLIFIKNTTDKDTKAPFNNSTYGKALKDFSDQLTLKRYSQNTMVIYKEQITRFFKHYPGIDPFKLADEDVKEYMLHLLKKKKISLSYQKQVVSAIKFYFEKVLGRDTKKYYFEIPRIKEQRLPIVLSKSEVKTIINSTNNLKHKAILSTIYSAGLRLSEVVNLKIADIDSERKLIYVREGKGKKDRTTILSKDLIDLLREYFKMYQPKIWLYESSSRRQYSTISVQKLFYRTLEKTKIDKKVSVHSLRHSFATHLLEQGEDLRYIQKLLGHRSSNTTEIYTHITKQGIGMIKSPLDNLDIEDKD